MVDFVEDWVHDKLPNDDILVPSKHLPPNQEDADEVEAEKERLKFERKWMDLDLHAPELALDDAAPTAGSGAPR